MTREQVSARSVAVIIMAMVLISPTWADLSIKLQPVDLHTWTGGGDLGLSGTVQIVPVYSGAQWQASVNAGTVFVEARKVIPVDPPGQANMKIADLYVGGQHVDVIYDNPYHCAALSGSEGAADPGVLGEFIENPWPTDGSGNYYPLRIVDDDMVEAAAGYEFVRWTGDPVDKGYVSDPQNATLYTTADYLVDQQKQYYVYAQFGVTTPTGTGVTVALPGTSVTLEFSNIAAAGHTILVESDSGPELPMGYLLGEDPVYYDITATAAYSGPLGIGLPYSGFDGVADGLRLLCYEDGAWVDCTTLVDPVAQMIYGTADSLAPFVVAQAVPLPSTALLGMLGFSVVGVKLRKSA